MSTPRYRSDPPSRSGSAISVSTATTPSSPGLKSLLTSQSLAREQGEGVCGGTGRFPRFYGEGGSWGKQAFPPREPATGKGARHRPDGGRARLRAERERLERVSGNNRLGGRRDHGRPSPLPRHE